MPTESTAQLRQAVKDELLNKLHLEEETAESMLSLIECIADVVPKTPEWKEIPPHAKVIVVNIFTQALLHGIVNWASKEAA